MRMKIKTLYNIINDVKCLSGKMKTPDKLNVAYIRPEYRDYSSFSNLFCRKNLVHF